MFTYQQIKDALGDGRYSGQYDPEMLSVLKKLFGSPAISDQEFITRLNQPAGQYDSGRGYILSMLEPTPGADLRGNVDRYINWNNPEKPQDQAAAFKEREKALTALNEKSKQLAAIGVDIKSIPQYAEFYSQLGDTAGAGQTSAQTARDLGQTTVNLPDVPVNTASDTQGASVGTYKPATSGGSSVGTYQPNSDNLPSSIAPITNNQYVYDSGHLGSKANDAAVNQLYNSYFGRNATAAELANWGNKGNSTVQQVEDFLQSERTKYNVTTPVKNLSGDIITTPTSIQTASTGTKKIYRIGSDIYDASTNKKIPDVATLTRDYSGATEIPAPTSSSSGKSIYRIGNDIYDAQTNQRIPDVATLTRDYAGAKEVAAPTTTNNGTTNNPAPSSGKRIYRIGNDIYDADTGLKIPDVATLTRDYAGATEVPAPANSGAGANNSSQQTGVGVYQQNQANAAAEAAKNGTGSPTGTTSEISAEDKKWINDLYQKYFDRTATSAEIANWASSTPAALDQFLVSEQKKYGYVSNAQKAVQSDKLKAALAIIDASNLPDEIKALWRQTVSLYPDATDFQPQQIIDTFNKIKTETVDPYFKELTDLAVGDVKTAFNQLKDARTSELESERYNSADAIRQARAGLEKSGMTFTGKGIEQLGASSAYAQNDAGTGVPAQIGFAGMPGVFYEGNVNQANRLLSTSTAARYAAQQQTLGRAAENQLGSGAVAINLPGLQYTPGNVNVTGSLEQQKQGKMASTLQGIIENWKTSQNLKTNI